MADEGFKVFSTLFANYPTLQKELSLLDKPATIGKLLVNSSNKTRS